MQAIRMTWIGGLAVSLCGFVPAAGGDKVPPQPVSGKIKWVYDYAEGKEAARRSGKPMFVVFRCER